MGAFGDIDLTLNHRTALAAARLLSSAAIVPVHAEGWAHFTESLELLQLHFDLAGLTDRLHVLSPGIRTALVPSGTIPLDVTTTLP